MKITKYHNSDRKIAFDITELSPLDYEAIYRGLELMTERRNLQNGLHAPKMLDAMKEFKAAEPKEARADNENNSNN